MLRALILLLLCMNIGVALWWAQHREPLPHLLPASDVGVSSLTLVSEVEPQAKSAVVAPSIAPDPLSATPLCLSIGPFNSSDDLRKAMNTLMPEVGRIQFRQINATALHGYRVYLPAAANREQALETARALSARGVNDIYVVTAGDQQNSISLGIFRDLVNAQKRRDQAVAFGYNATIEPRTEQVPQWWLDVAAPDGFDWHALLPDSSLQAVTAQCF